jgi:signal transduction histidine kinase
MIKPVAGIFQVTSINAINWFSMLTITIVFGISISAMSGWVLDRPSLYRLSDNLPPMVPRTTFFLFLLSTSALFQLFTNVKIFKITGILFALLTMACSSAVLISFYTNIPQFPPILWGTQLLENLQLPSLLSSPHTAISALLLSSALIMIRLKTPLTSLLTDALIFIVIAFTMFILFAYSFQVETLFVFKDNIGMSLFTATAFNLLAWGILFKHAKPSSYSAILFLPFTTGNFLIRGGLLGIILIPVLLAWVSFIPPLSSFSTPVAHASISTLMVLLLALSSIQLSFYLSQHENKQSKANKKIAETQQQLSHLSRVDSLGEMASSIAHELKQPLAAINNYISGCEKQQIKPPRVAEAFQQIKAQTSRMNSIINALRAMVKKSPPHFQSIKIPEVFADLMPLLKPELTQRNVQLSYNLPNKLPRIHSDIIQLQQVFLNLIQNAMDAIDNVPIDRKRIKIDGCRYDNQYVKITVKDYGIGMTKEQLENLFHPFVTNKSSKGMGIGLSVVRSIIESHCGTIGVDSTLGKGTTFTLLLPIAVH